MAELFLYRPGPEYASNSYFYGVRGEGAVLFDPGGDGRALKAFSERHFRTLHAVFLTHAHYDHWAGLAPHFDGVPAYLAAPDIEMAGNASHNLSFALAGEVVELPAERFLPLEEERSFSFPGLGPIQVLFTPSHTPGSVSYYLSEISSVLSGDALFRLSIGRTDLPLGNASLVPDAMRKFLALPPSTKVYPGHGPKTDLSTERLYNPYLSPFAKKSG